MKNILLATTALVMSAGFASAEVTWSGSATAGFAREGKVAAVAARTLAQATTLGLTTADVSIDTLDEAATIIGNTSTNGVVNGANSVALITAAIIAAQQDTVNAATATLAGLTKGSAAYTTAETALDLQTAVLTGLKALAGTGAKAVGDMKDYSEVNLTAKATVETDAGISLSVGVSVDGGTGYDFADDDGFDADKTNGVGLDAVTISGGFGAMSFDSNNIAHLVDADDDKTGDISYKGTFGGVTIQAVVDQAKDANTTVTAAAYTWTTANPTAMASYAAQSVADVAWSAAINGTMAGVAWRYAADEEGGYAASASMTAAEGLTVGVSTKREAAQKDLGTDANNGVNFKYTTAGLTLSGAWDSVKDGNQSKYGLAYTADAITVAYNTDQAEKWTASATYALGAGASLVAQTNYTEDAQIGVSFSF